MIIDVMAWQILTAICVLAISVAILLQRQLLHRYKVEPISYSVMFQLIVGAVLIIAALINGFSLAGLADIWPIALLCIILYGVGTVVYALTLQKVEASVFSVYFATHAIWVMMLGILLFNETLSFWQVVGSLLIFASVVLLVPSIKHFKLNKGAIYGIATGLIYGGAITSWAYVGKEVDDTLSWAALSFIAGAFVSFMIKPSAILNVKPLLRPKVSTRMIALGAIYAIGSATMLFAYKYGTYSVVSPLRQTGIIVTVLLALIFIKDERINIKTKLIAATISFVGVLLLIV